MATSNEEGAVSNEEGATSKEGVARNQTTTEREKNKKRGESKTKKGEKHEKYIYKLFFTFIFYINYINSRFKKYEPARFRLVGKLGRNQFRLSPTLAGKSPNPTGTLTLFLGLCPTLLHPLHRPRVL